MNNAPIPLYREPCLGPAPQKRLAYASRGKANYQQIKASKLIY